MLGIAAGCSMTSNSASADFGGAAGDGTGVNPDGGSSGAAGSSGSTDGAGGAPAPPERELDSAYQVPVATGRFVWIANPTSGHVAYVDATSLAVKTVEAGNAPTTVAAVPDPTGGDQVVVLNVLSNDVTLLRTDGTSLASRTIPGVVAGANRLVASPHGRYAIAWTDGKSLANVRATQGFQTITVLDFVAVAPAAAHTTLAVGFRPASVSFSADERRAFAVTEDGVSIVTLDGADGPRVDANVALGDDPTASADTRDVSITGDGRFAIVRREGSHTVSVVDLATGAITALPLSGAVTDVDITADGTRAVAVVRDTSEVALIPLGAAAPTAADVIRLTITGETIGQAVLTADGATAILYSNAVSSERVTVLALGAAPASTPSWRTLRLHAPVLSVVPTPDGRSAVVLHPNDSASPPASNPDGGPADGGTPDAGASDGARAATDAAVTVDASVGPSGTPAAGAFSLLPLDGTHPALIQATDAPIQAVGLSPAGDRVLVTVRDDGHAIFGVYLGLFPTLEVRRYPLASPPIATGVAAAAGRGYVAQQHPDGRITLIALDSGDARTLTGYELGARVVDWSRP
jgi:hypothetical protein